MPFISEEIYSKIPQEISDEDIERVQAACSVIAKRAEHTELEGVKYVTFTFNDESTLRFGNNGYIGCEYPSAETLNG